MVMGGLSAVPAAPHTPNEPQLAAIMASVNTMAPVCLAHTWHRVLLLLGDPSDLDAEAFVYAMRSIETLTDVLLARPPSLAAEPCSPAATEPIAGNSLLRLFGGWLFRAVAKVSHI